MARMTGGEAIVDALLRQGVDTIFGLPGVQLYGLFDGFAKASNQLRLINARHEQTTAYMALGAAKSTGKPAVYAVVPGPGMLNTTAALASALAVNAPILCLTGQVPSTQIGRGRGQLHEIPDQLATMRTLVKWADRIEHPTQAHHLVARAFQEMASGRTAPVALEMPWDIFSLATEVTPSDPLPLLAAPVPDPGTIAAAAEAIAKARAPMIVAGGGAVHAGDELRALAEWLGAPVISYRGGRGIVDDFHPLGANVIVGTRLWAETDLLIGVGSRLDNPGRWGATPPGLKVLRIDIDPAEMRRYKPDFGVVADAAAGVAALVVALQALPQPAGRRAEVNAAKLAVADAVAGVQPQVSYLRELAAVLPDDAFIVDEMTQVGYTSWFAYPFRKPGRLIGSGYQGTLGAGFPIALGVKAVNPGTPVVSITGDGGFLFGATELATAVQHKINLVTVLFNNSAYGNVLRDQKRLYQGRHAGAELQNPDFQLFAQSFGVPSWRVENPAAFRSALEAALAENSPTLIEVITDIAQETSPWPLVFPTRP